MRGVAYDGAIPHRIALLPIGDVAATQFCLLDTSSPTAQLNEFPTIYPAQRSCDGAASEGGLRSEVGMNKRIEEMKREIEKRGGMVMTFGVGVPDEIAEHFMQEVLHCPDCGCEPPKGETIDKILTG